MSDKIELPDYLKDLVDDSANQMVTNTGGGHPRISLKGRAFRFIEDGEEVHKQTEPIHVIVVGVVPEQGMAQTFYIDGYVPGSTDPPDCSSFLGVVPDSWISSPQAENCAQCPQNKWGSATSMKGKKAKACKNSKRLMVIKAADLKEEKPTVYVLNVTIASLRALTEFGKFLIENSLPMSAIITEVAFVDSDFPQVDFSFKAVLKKEHGTRTLEMAANKVWLDGAQQIEAPAAKPQIASTPPVGSAEASTPVDNGQSADDALDNWSA